MSEDTLTCIRFRPKNSSQKNLKVLQMHTEDYFYGSIEANHQYSSTSKNPKNYKCKQCKKTLYSNLRYMSHVKHKVIKTLVGSNLKKQKLTCTQCYRMFDKQYKLKNHVTAVHSNKDLSCVCRICNLHFPNDNRFLGHMNNFHCFKEMPFACEICSFKSSHYTEIVKHYKDIHINNSRFMCNFCLRVLTTANLFLDHCMQHISQNHPCYKCNLQFITKQEMEAHLEKNHDPHHHLLKGKKFKDYEICVYNKLRPLQQALAKSPEIPIETFAPQIKTEFDTSFPFPSKKSQYYVCWECKRNVGKTVEALKTHFKNSYNCNKCTFKTNCSVKFYKHNAKNHVTQEEKIPHTGRRKRKRNLAFKSTGGGHKRKIVNIKTEKSDSDDDVIFIEDESSGSSTKKKRKTPAMALKKSFSVKLNTDATDLSSPSPATKSKAKSSSENVYQFQFLPSGNDKTETKILLLNNSKKREVVMPGNTQQNQISFKRIISLRDIPRPPTNIHVFDVTSTTMMVGWFHPLGCSITQYRVTFKGAGQPTTQFLPPHQTLVRLVELKPATDYTVRVYSVYKSEQSLYNEIRCTTLTKGAVAKTTNVVTSTESSMLNVTNETNESGNEKSAPVLPNNAEIVDVTGDRGGNSAADNAPVAISVPQPNNAEVPTRSSSSSNDSSFKKTNETAKPKSAKPNPNSGPAEEPGLLNWIKTTKTQVSPLSTISNPVPPPMVPLQTGPLAKKTNNAEAAEKGNETIPITTEIGKDFLSDKLLPNLPDNVEVEKDLTNIISLQNETESAIQNNRSLPDNRNLQDEIKNERKLVNNKLLTNENVEKPLKQAKTFTYSKVTTVNNNNMGYESLASQIDKLFENDPALNVDHKEAENANTGSKSQHDADASVVMDQNVNIINANKIASTENIDASLNLLPEKHKMKKILPIGTNTNIGEIMCTGVTTTDNNQ